MEYPIKVAKAKFAELVDAPAAGERTIVTSRGRPVAEIVGRRESGCIDFAQLAADRSAVGIRDSGHDWPAEFDEPGLSRRVLGLE